jgi:hypothetical protein
MQTPLLNNRVGHRRLNSTDEILVVSVVEANGIYQVVFKQMELGSDITPMIVRTYDLLYDARITMNGFFHIAQGVSGFRDMDTPIYDGDISLSQVKYLLAPEPDEPDPDLVDIRYPDDVDSVQEKCPDFVPVNEENPDEDFEIAAEIAEQKQTELKAICLDNTGMTDRFEVGKLYPIEILPDKEMLKATDRNGEQVEMFRSRFQFDPPTSKMSGEDVLKLAGNLIRGVGIPKEILDPNSIAWETRPKGKIYYASEETADNIHDSNDNEEIPF